MPLSRRQFLGMTAAGSALAVGTSAYAGLIEPYWLDVHDSPISLPGWPAALSGLRIAHLTDVHFDWKLSKAYTREVARRIREEIKPDLVAFTGDLTSHNAERLPAAAEWLASFGAPTFACLGNHDYDPETSVRVGAPLTLATELERLLSGTGVTLLRNRSARFTFKDAPLHIVGVEDYYTGLLDPRRATEGIPPDEPRLMLCHNPDAADLVDPYAASEGGGGLVLAGHTHGGQIRLPYVGQILFNTMNTSRSQGLYPLGKSQLYISRGIGFLVHARLFCRPELPVHVIEAGQAG